MASEVVYQFTDRKLRAGDRLAPTEVPPAKLAGRDLAILTIAVDDPTAEPPTDAKLEGTIEASEDGGASWFAVATLWAGTSGTLTGRIGVAGRRIRVQGRADAAATLSLTVEVA